jgi:hypothetical protein
MIDRPPVIHDLMERGISYDDAIKRIDLGDRIHDQGNALEEAVAVVKELICCELDAPRTWHWDRSAFGDAIPNLERAWREFQESVSEAQRLVGRP